MKIIHPDTGIFILTHREADGEPIASWVDDPAGILMDTPQDKVGEILGIWPAGITLDIQSGGEIGDTLHSPSAFIFLPQGRRKIESYDEIKDFIEWLPIIVNGVGICYVCHPCKFIPFQAKSMVERVSVGRNISGVKKFIFDEGIEVPPIFLMECPLDSRAGKLGFGIGYIFVSSAGQKAFADVSSVAFRPT